MFGLDWGDGWTIAMTVATLVLLEGLLSADNALVLAVMVKHLPKPQQKQALRYGIWGAFLFRFIAVLFAYQLIQYWAIKLAGGLYLLFLAIKHFLARDPEDHDGEGKVRRGRGLWWTVVYVELADIAFSIDSILAAVALVDALPPKLQHNHNVALAIIYIGGVLGIIMMRLVAGVFLILLNRFRGLASGAYVLVGWIGIKLIGSALYHAFHVVESLALDIVMPAYSNGTVGVAMSGVPRNDWRAAVPVWIREFPWELPDWAFWVGMAAIVAFSMIQRPRKASHPRQTDSSPAP